MGELCFLKWKHRFREKLRGGRLCPFQQCCVRGRAPPGTHGLLFRLGMARGFVLQGLGHWVFGLAGQSMPGGSQDLWPQIIITIGELAVG